MKRYIKSDVNSYTQYRDTSDAITLAEYETDENGYGSVTLEYESFTVYLSYYKSYDYSGDEFYKDYPILEIDSAISDFNKYERKLGGSGNLTRRDVDEVMLEYGKSLADFEPGGFYDELRRGE